MACIAKHIAQGESDLPKSEIKVTKSRENIVTRYSARWKEAAPPGFDEGRRRS